MSTAISPDVTSITVDAADGPAEVYLARPDGTPRAGIVLYMDALGLRPQIAEMAARIASWGYGVIAPHVFYRWGTADELSPDGPLMTPEERAAFFGPAVMGRIEGYTAALSRQDDVAWVEALTSELGDVPIGTTGYCFGARLATQLAGELPERVAAVGGWHGAALATDAPDSPHTFLAAATAEFHYGHADHDPSMPPDAVAALGSALSAAGLTHRNEIFAGAAHGYTMKDTSSYGAEHENRHWQALEALYARTF